MRTINLQEPFFLITFTPPTWILSWKMLLVKLLLCDTGFMLKSACVNLHCDINTMHRSISKKTGGCFCYMSWNLKQAISLWQKVPLADFSASNHWWYTPKARVSNVFLCLHNQLVVLWSLIMLIKPHQFRLALAVLRSLAFFKKKKNASAFSEYVSTTAYMLSKAWNLSSLNFSACCFIVLC